jgi:hypothetical protein
MSMAHARNMCLSLGLSLFAPEYVCMMEDDHGLRRGAIPALIRAMQKYYGKESPNGLRYGLFTACRTCWKQHKHHRTLDGHAYPAPHLEPGILGGANSCFRCAPTTHWVSVLKGYDADEYPISSYQTRNLSLRNYHCGFTSLAVKNGSLCFDVDRAGHGVTLERAQRPWDPNYAASDLRSSFQGKEQGNGHSGCRRSNGRRVGRTGTARSGLKNVRRGLKRIFRLLHPSRRSQAGRS